MVKFKKTAWLLLMYGFVSISILSPSQEVLIVEAAVTQKRYALLAENVQNVWLEFDEMALGTVVFISQKEKEVLQIDLMKRLKTKDAGIYYKNYLIAEGVKAFFPNEQRIFVQNEKNEILFTGENKCYSMFEHKSVNDCDHDSYEKQSNEMVLEGITRCWGDHSLFAYVQNNNLVLTGSSVAYRNGECDEVVTKGIFFKGKADQIKQVVAGSSNIFVLMKDGSVWGRGSNYNKLISNSSTKFHRKFVKIVSRGVKSIEASFENVGMLKKDGTLWLWGAKTKGNKITYSKKPYKIANNVKEFSLGCGYGSRNSTGTVLLFLNKNSTAYGWGSNHRYAFTSKYKKSWISKPVKLRSNVKHVYAGREMTFLLDNRNRLYWAGKEWNRGIMYWGESKETS